MCFRQLPEVTSFTGSGPDYAEVVPEVAWKSFICLFSDKISVKAVLKVTTCVHCWGSAGGSKQPPA